MGANLSLEALIETEDLGLDILHPGGFSRCSRRSVRVSARAFFGWGRLRIIRSCGFAAIPIHHDWLGERCYLPSVLVSFLRGHRLGRLGPAGVEAQMDHRLGDLSAGQTALKPAAQVGIELVVVTRCSQCGDGEQAPIPQQRSDRRVLVERQVGS